MRNVEYLWCKTVSVCFHNNDSVTTLFLAAGLNERDCAGDNDVVRRTAAAQVADRFCKSLKNRTVCVCMSKALDEFVADVSRVEVRKNERIDFASDRAARCLFVGDRRNQRCISLKLAVEQELRSHLVRKADAFLYGEDV